MKSGQELFNEHLNRIKTAISLEKPDRVPVAHDADNVAAKYKGLKLADFCTDPLYANQKALEGILELGCGEFDAVHLPVNIPQFLGTMWLSDMKLPGRELKENDIWQLDEKPLMTEDDYDFIIDKGWDAFFQMYAATRLKDDIIKPLHTMMELAPVITHRVIEAGIVPLTGGAAVQSPIEVFFATRSTGKFMRDLFRIPDKVQAAADVMFEADMARLKEVLASPHKPFALFIGGARVSSESLSPKLWDRFFWRYMMKVVEVAEDSGIYFYLHMDGNWERDLAVFRQFPKGRCIFACDGFTNIYKVKEVLGDWMCVMGDVPPSLMALGTPDEVYNYSLKLINEIGTSGFILSPGCIAPANTKPENLKAMLAAATNK